MRLAALLLTASNLFAADAVEIWSRSQIKSDAMKLTPAPRIYGKTLGAWGTHSASLWKRTSSGDAELHKTKADLMIVEEGSATFVSGGSITGGHPTTAGEIRGASITGGQTRKLVPGDVIHVAPNTPHQFLLDKGETITYIAVKIAR